MRATTRTSVVMVALLCAAWPVERAEGQSLAQRVRAVGTGVVELHFAARSGVCGDGRRSLSIGERMHIGEWTANRGTMPTCLPGPARARVRVERGTVTSVRVTAGPQVAYEERTTDLGAVPSTEAATYFLALADTSDGPVARGAITAAVVADSVSVWRQLLAIATDTARVTQSTRRSAMFWVGRFAAAKVAGHGEDIGAVDESDDRDDPRDAAVFALSQLRGKRGVEPLLEIARTHKDPEVRQKAIFWLGESGDQRAVKLFREILAG